MTLLLDLYTYCIASQRLQGNHERIISACSSQPGGYTSHRHLIFNFGKNLSTFVDIVMG
jgi:hypothetical protein